MAVMVSVNAGPKKVHTIGDSTMATYATDGSTDKRGWCQFLQQFFNAENVKVNNRGKSGASSKSFYKESSYWPTLAKGGSDQMQAGDYLLIQFAHNDEKSAGTDGDEENALHAKLGDGLSVDYRGTTASGTFKTYIKAYIDEAKAMGVTPIVVGPICRKYFSGNTIQRNGQHDLGDKFNVIKDGQLLENQKVPATDDTYDYVVQAKNVADSYEDVPFLDLTEVTKELYLSYGDAACTEQLFCQGDKTHLNEKGAVIVGREFAKLLQVRAASETDAKKKAVLEGLAKDLVISNEMNFTPSTGDMGKAFVGSEITADYSLSAFGLTPEAGNVTFSVTEGFEVSADKTSWSQSVDVPYTNSTFIGSIAVRATAMSGVLNGTLTATDGTNSKTIDLKLEGMAMSGDDVTVTYPLTADGKAAENTLVTAADQTLSELSVKQYSNVGETDPVQMQLLTTTNGEWPANEIDEVSTRYAQFKITVPEGKVLYADKISFTVAGQGGSGVSYHAYYATKSDFSDQKLISEKVAMTAKTPMPVEAKVAAKVDEGESIYIRFYPWYNNQSGVATGKYLCLANLNIHGTLSNAAIDASFGIGRELNGTTFAEGQEKVMGDLPPGVVVEQISTCDYPGTNQTIYHGNKTTAYTAANVWRNYLSADKVGVQNAYNDKFYWGFKVSIPEGQQMNVSSIMSDVYGVKNTLTSKFVVKASLAGNALYESGNHAANVESGDKCEYTEDVSQNTNLQGLTGDIYFIMPWYSGSSATYYALKDFVINATFSTAQKTTKHTLNTSVTPEGAGSIIIDPEGVKFDEGKAVTLTAKKNFGYKFVEWQDAAGNSISTDAQTTITMDADKDIKAVFEAVPTYSLKTACVNDAERSLGSITIVPNEHNGMYEAGETVTLTANESKILKFLSWSDDVTTAKRTITIEGDVDLKANFEVQDFIAVFDASAVEGYADRVTYPFAADLTWDAQRNATAKIVRVDNGTAVKGAGSTPVVRNRKSVVLSTINGLYQNGYNTTDIAWQYQFSTKGFTSARIECDMAAKNSASKSWKAQYSLDGATYTDLEGAAWDVTENTQTPLTITLPADAIGKDLVYVRFTGVGDAIAGKAYAFDKTFEGMRYASNSESGFGNMYVLGEAEVAADEQAPVLKSVVPADGATDVPATGTITVSYDERIQAGSVVGATATLNGEEVTPQWNSRSVSFQYVNLEYGKTYTFAMPKGFVEDKSGNSADALSMSFTIMDRQKPQARTFNAIVDRSLEVKKIDATADMPAQYRYIQDAIDEAPSVNDKPYLIYIKEGYYNDPNETFSASYGTRYTTSATGQDAPKEQIPGGKNKYDDCRLIYVNKPNIHLIGQAVDKVTIATDRLDGDVRTDPSRVWYHVNAGAALEVQAGGTDFFMQGITLDNENWTIHKMEGPQALSMNITADRAVFDGINARSYQDTYKSDGLYNRQFFNNSTIEGGVDFIYGNGDVWFENCTLNINRKSGGWIVAPDHPEGTRWGYVFNNTKITTTYAAAPEDFQISLGRPWHNAPMTVFLHTQMEVKPIKGYWSETMGGLPKLWAVYDIWDRNGVQLSNESISQYYYTDGNGQKVYGTAKNFLTDEEAAQYTIANVMAGDKTTSAKGFWNPQAIVEKTSVPVLSETSGVVTWTADPYAICYVVTVNGKPVAFPTEAQFTASKGDIVTVQSVNEHGALSAMSEAITVGDATGIKDLGQGQSQGQSQHYYNLAGQRLSPRGGVGGGFKGIIIKNGTKVVIK